MLLLFLACFLTGPGFYENLPTCDFRAPLVERCREVRGQWGGEVGGRVREPG